MFAGLLASIGLKLAGSSWTSWLLKVPRWAWIALAAVLAVVAIMFWHGGKVHSFKKDVQLAQMAADNDHWRTKLAKEHTEAVKWKTQFDQASTKMSQAIREKNDAKVRAINTDTSNLLRDGPGKARCGQGNYSIPSSTGSRPQSADRPGANPVAQVPDPGGTDLIALPFNDTVRSFGQCDINATRLGSWNEWYKALEKSWPKP